jgi:hypothetical protein
MSDPNPSEMTLAQLGHHTGLRLEINLAGRTVGDVFFDGDHWVTGKIVGVGALGSSLTIELDAPIGGGSRGFLGRRSKGEDMISVDDPALLRQVPADGAAVEQTDEEVRRLVAEGKTKDAIARYRADTGATLEEARAFIARL